MQAQIRVKLLMSKLLGGITNGQEGQQVGRGRAQEDENPPP